jgi:hypothetical protein
MARKWAVFDDWSGGGFFNNGSFRGEGRFRSLNMQTYANGSIGPRPQFRKLEQSADAGSSIPSIAAAFYPNLKWGGGWSGWAPTGWTYGAVIFATKATADQDRRIRINDDGTCEYFSVADSLTLVPTGSVSMTPAYEASGIHAVKPVMDG